MEVIQQFTFAGTFQKTHQNDDKPISDVVGNIFCYDNGLVLLEVEPKIAEAINGKVFFDSGSLLIGSEIRPPYQGGYQIQGRTVEGFEVEATFREIDTALVDDINSKLNPDRGYFSFVDLQLLNRNNNITVQEEGAVYGVSCVDINQDIILNNAQLYFSVKWLRKGNSNKLNAEFRLSKIPTLDDKLSYYTYYSWLSLLLAFSSGRKVYIIYEKITDVDENCIKVIFLGRLVKQSEPNFQVIKNSYLSPFFKKCSNQVSSDLFDDKGLGLALYWYSTVTNTEHIEIRFLILCTVLEILVKRNAGSVSQKLISTAIHRKIRQEVESILENYKNNIEEDYLSNYEIYRKKVYQPLESGNANQVGPLRAKLQNMLEVYCVFYNDLFPELEFINVRDDLIHRGFSEVGVTPYYIDLHNLVIRVLLAFLGYQGNYQEYVESMVEEKSTGTYKAISKKFPLPIE
ncbi:hypothetical protein U2F10_21740 [Leptothoe sp. EHU-05/26/07-4]